jgi:diacylglycerol kinase (ATP)
LSEPARPSRNRPPEASEPAPPAESPYKGKTGLARIVQAFFNSLAGLGDAWRHESAFRQEILLAAILVPLACALPLTGVERALLVGSVLLVLIVELLNSSIEAAIDRISFDQHSLSKRAKDIGSAAVLVALVLLAIVWGSVLLPRSL